MSRPIEGPGQEPAPCSCEPQTETPKDWLLPRLRALIADAVFRADAADGADDPAERRNYVHFAAALTNALRDVEVGSVG